MCGVFKIERQNVLCVPDLQKNFLSESKAIEHGNFTVVETMCDKSLAVIINGKGEPVLRAVKEKSLYTYKM